MYTFTVRLDKPSFGLNPSWNYGLRAGEISIAQKLFEEHQDEIRSRWRDHFGSAEVTQIDKYGIWLLIADKESFLPFENFPAFREASVGAIHNVELLTNNRLHWPDLNLEISLESLSNRQPLNRS